MTEKRARMIGADGETRSVTETEVERQAELAKVFAERADRMAKAYLFRHGCKAAGEFIAAMDQADADSGSAAPTCPIHHTPLTCAACTGAQGGKATSPKKAKAAQANARKPRPRKAP
jgi:hypothetical protein